jgi:hypothetical protein
MTDEWRGDKGFQKRQHVLHLEKLRRQTELLVPEVLMEKMRAAPATDLLCISITV